jgi:hypothetical protein
MFIGVRLGSEVLLEGCLEAVDTVCVSASWVVEEVLSSCFTQIRLLEGF